MSARRLTPVEEDVLALGLNFAVVPHVLPKEEFVQRLEVTPHYERCCE